MRKKRFTAFLLSMAMAGTSLYTCGVIDVQAAAVAEDQAENPNLEQLAEIQEQAAVVEEDGAVEPEAQAASVEGSEQVAEPEIQAKDTSGDIPLTNVDKADDGTYEAEWGKQVGLKGSDELRDYYFKYQMGDSDSEQDFSVGIDLKEEDLGKTITVRRYNTENKLDGTPLSFKVVAKTVTNEMMQLDMPAEGVSYNGKDWQEGIENKVSVCDGGNVMTRQNGDFADLVVTNGKDPGTAHVEAIINDTDKSGKPHKYRGSCGADFTINPRKISDVSINISPNQYYYTGDVIKPNELNPKSTIVTDTTDEKVELESPRDYTIEWKKAVSAGEASAVIKLNKNGRFVSTNDQPATYEKEKVFKILSADSAHAAFKVSFSGNATGEFTFGTSLNEISANVIVSAGDRKVVSSDYTVQLQRGQGKLDGDTPQVGGGYVLRITGRGNYDSSVYADLPFTIIGAELSENAISINLLDGPSYNYSGKNGVRPKVEVSINGHTKGGVSANVSANLLREGKDYTVEYENNINVASAGDAKKAPKVIVTLKDYQYSGTGTLSFSINKADISGNALASYVVSNKKKVYNGDRQYPDVKLDMNFGSGAETLTAGTDYQFILSKNNTGGINSGNYYFTISGAGNFEGAIDDQDENWYEITRKSISDPDIKRTMVLQPSYNYTGEPIEPELSLRYTGLLDPTTHRVSTNQMLIKDRDYVVHGKNNVDMGDHATIEVTGKGNYTGTLSGDFTITSTKGFTKVTINSDNKVTYKGKGKALSEADLNVKVYSDSKEISSSQYVVSLGDEVKETGNYTLTVYGKNDYAGRVISQNYTVVPKAFNISNVSVGDLVAYYYKGESGGMKLADPVPETISDNVTKEMLEENVDYVVTNVRPSQSQCSLKGIGNYTGEITSQTYRITKSDLGKIKTSISFNGDPYVYQGTRITIDPKRFTVRDVSHGVDLVLYEDYYTGAAPSTTAAGTVYIDIIGRDGDSAYVGRKSVSINILQKDISDTENVKQVGETYSLSVDYAGETKFIVSDNLKTGYLSYNGFGLSANTDYDVKLLKDGKERLSYNEVGQYSIIAVGKGNYTGQRELGTLTVNTAKLVPEYFRLTEDTFSYNGYPHEPKVIVSGNKYIETQDFTVTYPQPEESLRRGTHTVTITGINNYDGSTVSLNFTVEPQKLVSENTKAIYAGMSENGLPLVQVTVDGKALEYPRDYTYEAVSINNTDPQEWKVTITGQDGYYGTVEKTVQFGQIDLLDEYVSVVSTDLVYNGEKQTPSPENIIVKVFDKVLTLDKDYTVAYPDDSVNAGSYEVEITGKGDYQGTAKGTYVIKPATFTEADVTIQSSVEYTGSIVNPVKVTVGGKELVLDQDYTVKPEEGNMVDAGEKTLKIEGIGNYAGSEVTGTCTITAASLKDAKVTVQSVTYTGSAQKAKVTLVVKNRLELREGIDYTVESKSATNAGTVDVKVTGKGNYTGTAIGKFTINPRDLSKGAISGIKNRIYNKGKAVTQPSSLKIVVNNKTLKKGTDYTVSYKNNKNIGQASFTIKGKGNYKGTTVAKTFNIYPKKSTIQSLKAGSKRFTVQVKKQKKGITYQIQYKVKGSKSYTRIETKNAKKVIKGLRKGKTYTVRVRTFETVKKVRYYGEFSKAKNVKIKK